MSGGWLVNAATDFITFDAAPPVGVGNVVVNEYATASRNATAIWALGAWNGEYGYPAEVEFYADRLDFAATRSQPQTLWMSRIGDYSMFGKSTPILDDDAITVTMNARKLNRIVDLMPKQHLLALTTGAVWKIGGGDSEVLTPSTASTRPQPSMGSGELPALNVGETAVYLTQKGGQVRDLAFTFEADGYAGSDLTAFASHLLEGYALTDWDYQDVPYSCVYAVRSDGWLLTMTYKREHQVVAWTHQDTDGEFRSVTVIPEAVSNAVYAVVDREVNGTRVKYVERFADQAVDERDWVGVDCSLTYDGRNTSATTVTLTGTTFEIDDLLTLCSSVDLFDADNVGDHLVLNYDGEPLRITINAVLAPDTATGFASRTIPVELRTPATSWALAVNTFGGLSHLEGKTVAIAGDGLEYQPQVVAGGQITITPPAAVVHVGLPFVSEFESLDMMLAGGESVGTRTKLIKEIGVLVMGTRALHAGTSFDTLQEYKPRSSESMNLPPQDQTDWILLPVHGEWQANPSVCIRNTSPFRCTVLAIEPDVKLGK